MPLEVSTGRLRAGALIWWLVVLLAAAALGWRLHHGLALDADLQALLPVAQQQPLQQRALARLDQERDQRLLMLVGHEEAASARQAASQLASALLASPAIANASARQDPQRLEAMLALYAPVEGLLLTDAHRQALEQDKLQPLLSQALRQLHSPQAWITPISPARDPLLLHRQFLDALPQVLGQLRWSDGYLQTEGDGLHWVLVQASTRDGAFSQSRPQVLLQSLDAARQSVRERWPEAQLLAAGLPLHGAHAAARAQWEMRVIGGLSLLAVVALVLAVFRSARPLLLTLASISTGLLLALTLCSWIFERLHLMTLVVGASLVGVTVDYAFHYFAAARSPGQRLSALRRVGPAITLGLLTTALAYAVLLAAPFPGLRQMAVFSISGLAGAWFTVMALFPWAGREPNRPLPGGALRAVQALLRPRKGLVATSWVLTAALALLATQLPARDSVRSLYQPPAQLMTQDQALGARIAAVDPSRLFLITAADSESWLQANEALLSALAEHPDAATPVSVAQAVPSAARQHRARLALAPVYRPGGTLEQFAAASGLSQRAVQRLQRHYTDAGILSLQSWLQSPASEGLRGLWAGADEHGASGVVLLSRIEDEALLRQIAAPLPGVHYLNRVDQMSSLLADLRREAAALLALGVALAALILVLRYGLWSGLRTALPAALALIWVLGGLSALGIGFSLFHLFALLLVLGMGLDYAIFLRESAGHRAASALAIVMAALTTLLAFGLLALSQTPALRDFGQAVALGIVAALLLAVSLAPQPATGDRS